MVVIRFPLEEMKKILYYHRTYNEYKRLSRDLNSLKARMVGFDEVIKENTRLEGLLEFKRKLVYSSVAANIIGRDPSYWNSTIIIDKGKQDGLKVNQPVVNAQGVVGKIAEVGVDSSKVMLLTDPQFSVAGLIQNPREFGLVSGSLQGICRISYLDKKARVHLGDLVITSKLSSSFPEGILIGEVIQINDHLRNPSLEGVLKPSVNFSQIEEVLVILK